MLFPKAGDLSADEAVGVGPGANCFRLTARLGMLATGSDYWWELKRGLLFSDDRMVQRVATDLRQKWVEFGSPWFERLPDLRAARNEAACGWSLESAISMSLA